MCVAGLKVSTQPCAHRWYELVRNCHPANNLANCPEKLQLKGWEARTDICPWCDNDTLNAVHESTHRLFGSTSSASSTASSPTSFDLGQTRSSRSNSDGTMTPISRVSSTTSVESDRVQRDRSMNERLELYLRSHPHEVLPSAKKNYPTYSSSSSDEISPLEAPLLRRTSSGLSKKWKQSWRMSKGVFGM